MGLNEKFFRSAETGGGGGGGSFVAVAYEGNAIAAGFQPDLVWIKNRDAAWPGHFIDSFRKTNTYYDSLKTQSGQAQGTSNSYGVASLDLNGFTLGGSSGAVNANGNYYVAWCWKAGGAAVSNINGTIASQVSVNNDLGFSIVKYAGTGNADDVGHGLDSTPDLVIAKNIDSFDNGTNWTVYASPLSGEHSFLNGSNGFAASTAQFRADPDSTVLKLSNNSSSNVNRSGDNFMAYCFNSKSGVSKVGVYTGNGSGTSNYVETGFEPAFVILKLASHNNSTGSWYMFDNARGDNMLEADTSTDESAGDRIDFNSSGFTLKTSETGLNNSNYDYFYYAIA